MKKTSVKKSARKSAGKPDVHVYLRNYRGRFIGGFKLPKESFDILEKLASHLGMAEGKLIGLLLREGAEKVIGKAVAA